MLVHPFCERGLRTDCTCHHRHVRRHVAVGHDFLDTAARGSSAKPAEHGYDGYEHSSHLIGSFDYEEDASRVPQPVSETPRWLGLLAPVPHLTIRIVKNLPLNRSRT